MSKLDKHAVMSELQRFNQRKLNNGELMLLAYCIGNALPLIPSDTENPRMHLLGFSALLDAIRYRVNEVSYIDNTDYEFLKDNVARMLMWRTAVSRGKLTICFSGEPNVVIDELSGLTRFFDVGNLCAVGDIHGTGNWLMRVFTDLVAFEKAALDVVKGE